MTRRALAHLALIIFGIVLALIALEAAVRLAGEHDADGQFIVLGYTLEPYILPVTKLRQRIEEHLQHQDHASVIYDSATGWSYKPGAARQDGSFSINGAGIRSAREFDLTPPVNTLRIAAFGDSFTAGDDVADDETWSSQLERLLVANGIAAEVLNFGVGGYGMDQALLKWRHHGIQFQPHIVIFGLQPENLKRNVNVFRQLLDPSRYTLPFSKPRFALNEVALALLNSPPLPPEQLPEVFENFGQHPLARHEFHYRSRETAAHWWTSSRLAALLYALLKRDEERPGYYAAETEGGQLGKAIVDAFADSVARADATFVVAHLPLQSHLRRYHSDLPPPDPPYKFLLDHCRERYLYVAMEERLDRAYLEDRYWTATKHYGPAIHALVAEAVGERIQACVNSGECQAAGGAASND